VTRPRLELSAGEWAALGIVGEGPVHGYDVARALATDGPVGAVWTVPRPLVYRALQQLEAHGFVRPAAHEASERGPNRTVLQLTPSGRRALARWSLEPVEHVRDVRSVLLLKLALLDRRGQDPAPLLTAQRVVVDAIIAALRQRRTGADGFDAVLATWRLESARAVVRFLDAVAKGSAW
jgi:DNA-binding PadR family transcriptional regulator